jgi:hypothetical protein
MNRAALRKRSAVLREKPRNPRNPESNPDGSVTIHVVQTFEQHDDGVMAAEPKSFPSASSARAPHASR